jgi:2-polyprenyl-3-methyl-5-hydroxy-6-metoxy-1,4-benzoquinol methylase
MNDRPYIGQELQIFASAINWKKYWSAKIRPYLSGDVLEVGAGLGISTEYLHSPNLSSWTCLEPDSELADSIRCRFNALPRLRVETGTTETLGYVGKFDTILYIDVLEHIENDREEMARAEGLLRKGGRIVVIAPAHQWLYTAFDRCIGHFRRYNRASLLACSPLGCELLLIQYLDSAGMLASIGNRLLLQRSMPEGSHIFLWDRFLVPCSRWLDRLTMHSVGKSILGVWRKNERGCSV